MTPTWNRMKRSNAKPRFKGSIWYWLDGSTCLLQHLDCCSYVPFLKKKTEVVEDGMRNWLSLIGQDKVLTLPLKGDFWSVWFICRGCFESNMRVIAWIWQRFVWLTYTATLFSDFKKCEKMNCDVCRFRAARKLRNLHQSTITWSHMKHMILCTIYIM